MSNSERWSWRWWFDGEPRSAVWRWLLSVALASYAVTGVVVTRGRNAALLTCAGVILSAAVLQPLGAVSRLDLQLRRSKAGEQPYRRVPRWLDSRGRTVARLEATVPCRPASWYRTLMLVSGAMVVVDLVLTVALVRLPEQDFWWYLGVIGLPFMAILGAGSLLAAWRVWRMPTFPEVEPNETA